VVPSLVVLEGIVNGTTATACIAELRNDGRPGS